MKYYHYLLFTAYFLPLVTFSQNNENYEPPIEDSEVVGQDAFLQGAHIELGIRSNGSFVSQESAPLGYHPRSGSTLGLVMDPQKDGWTNGVPPQSDDFFKYGSPFEGFKVQFNGTEYDNIASKSITDIPGAIVSVEDLGGVQRAVWQGAVAGLFEVTQEVLLVDSEFRIYVNATVKNLTGSPAEVYYARVADPDQEFILTSNFSTNNSVKSLFENGGDYALVSAKGNTYENLYIGVGSTDPRARACISRDWDQLPSVYYNYGAGVDTTTLVGDFAIALTILEPSLQANASTVFELVYTFSEEDQLETCDTPLSLEVDYETKDANCSNADGGMRITDVSGGVEPYSFDFGVGRARQREPFIRDLPAGSYVCTIFDDSRCSYTFEYTIEKREIDLGLSVVTEPSVCTSDGLAIAQATNATLPVNYNWTGSFVPNDSINLPTGIYNLKVEDAQGCVDSTVFTILPDDSTLVVSLTTFDAICESQGLVIGEVSGGVAPYRFQWSLDYEEVDSFYNAPGFYNVTVVDSNGCLQPASYTIGQSLLELDVDVSLTKSTCGEPNGVVKAIVTGGVKPYTYQWEGNMSTVDSLITSAGFDIVFVKDSNGCIGSLGYDIEDITPIPDFAYDIDENKVDFSNSSSFYTEVSWSFGSAIDQTLTAGVSNFPLSITYPKGGTYPVTLRAFYGPSCSRSITKNVVIEDCVLERLVSGNYSTMEEEHFIKAKDAISAEMQVAPMVKMKLGADKSVSLLPGFLANPGAVFETVLSGCNY